MFKVSFSLCDNTDEITGFELGNITFESEHIIATSSNRKPDQSMMIFVTLSDVLSKLVSLVSNKRDKYVNVVGCDSSFLMCFIKRKERLELIVDGKKVADDKSVRILQTIYDAAKSFFELYSSNMEDVNPVKADVLSAFKCAEIFLNAESQ